MFLSFINVALMASQTNKHMANQKLNVRQTKITIFLVLLIGGIVFWEIQSNRLIQENWGGIKTIPLPHGNFSMTASGVFRIDGNYSDPPIQQQSVAKNLVVMKYHVSEALYARCVYTGACSHIDDGEDSKKARVGVSFFDAVNFAEWLSNISGQKWRLPSDVEWVRAAGEGYSSTARQTYGKDPSKRWIAEYKNKFSPVSASATFLRLEGAHEENSLGIAGLSAAVWEWTSTCLRYGQISQSGGRVKINSEFCGRRVAQGQHRAYVIAFVRDPSGGGCGARLPPEYLGIRLIREL